MEVVEGEEDTVQAQVHHRLHPHQGVNPAQAQVPVPAVVKVLRLVDPVAIVPEVEREVEESALVLGMGRELVRALLRGWVWGPWLVWGVRKSSPTQYSVSIELSLISHELLDMHSALAIHTVMRTPTVSTEATTDLEIPTVVTTLRRIQGMVQA